MRAFVSAVYLFLYAPIALVVLFSFNAGRNASEFAGFSAAWYGKAFTNTFLLQALQNSLIVAFCQRGTRRNLRHHGRDRHRAAWRPRTRRCLRRPVRRRDRRSRRRDRHCHPGRTG